MIDALLIHLGQSTVFLGVVGLLTRVLRRNGARSRYGLWFAASMKFLVPLAALQALLPARIPALSDPLQLPLLFSAAGLSRPLPGGAQLSAGRISHPSDALAAHLPAVLLILWLSGCAAVLWVWFGQWRRLRRARSEARYLRRIGPLCVLESPASIEPSLIGFWHPVVLLPQGLAQRLSAREIDAVLAHELCHYRRADNLSAALHMLVQALFWFFPPVWWLGARLLQERERACDEAVIAAGTDAATYAGGILKVCRFFVQPDLACAAGASGADLQQRVEAIMSETRARPISAIRRVFVGGALAAALGVTVLIGVRSLPRAQAASRQAMQSAAALHARRLAEQTRPRRAIPFNPADFDKFVGYYEVAPNAFFHVFRQGDHYFAQLTGQPPVRQYPESPTKFFATVVAAQISFVSDARGRVTGLVVHQNGYLQSAPRVSWRTVSRAESQLRHRIERNVPAPGTAAAVRTQILSYEHSGHAFYAQMTPALAAAARSQAGKAAPLFKALGAFHSLHHFKVLANGADDYLATFEHGELEVIIAPLTRNGKVAGLFFHPIPSAN